MFDLGPGDSVAKNGVFTALKICTKGVGGVTRTTRARATLTMCVDVTAVIRRQQQGSELLRHEGALKQRR